MFQELLMIKFFVLCWFSSSTVESVLNPLGCRRRGQGVRISPYDRVAPWKKCTSLGTRSYHPPFSYMSFPSSPTPSISLSSGEDQCGRCWNALTIPFPLVSETEGKEFIRDLLLLLLFLPSLSLMSFPCLPRPSATPRLV